MYNINRFESIYIIDIASLADFARDATFITELQMHKNIIQTESPLRQLRQVCLPRDNDVSP